MKSPRLALALLSLLTALPCLGSPAVATPPSGDPPSSSTELTFGDFVRGHGGTTCQQLIDECKGATAEDILISAMFPPPGHLGGTCYVHDDAPTDPPYTYAYHYYLKQSWRPGAKGYDGGTGAIGYPDALITRGDSALLAALQVKALCEAGQCCCPNLPPVEDCKPKVAVDAYDPRTGSCCHFANRCTIPEGWELNPGPTTDWRCW